MAVATIAGGPTLRASDVPDRVGVVRQVRSYNLRDGEDARRRGQAGRRQVPMIRLIGHNMAEATRRRIPA